MVSSRRGFKCIELLVVVGCVAMLAAVLFPAFTHAHGFAPNGRSVKKMAVGKDLPVFNTNNSANFDVTVNNPANLTYDYTTTSVRYVQVYFVATDGNDLESVTVTVPANSLNGAGTITAGTLLHNKNYSVALNSGDVIGAISTAP